MSINKLEKAKKEIIKARTNLGLQRSVLERLEDLDISETEQYNKAMEEYKRLAKILVGEYRHIIVVSKSLGRKDLVIGYTVDLERALEKEKE